MLRNYFLLFGRNLKRQRLFSTINLLGLTAGIVSTLLIYLYVQHELSFDRFHTHADRIYRINQTFIWGNHDDKQFASLGPGVAYALHAEVPEIEEVVRIHPITTAMVTNAENKNDIRAFEEAGILAVDSNFFRVFSFPLVKGSMETALQKPYSAILTASTARKYFGSEEAVGKLLQVGEDSVREVYEVTGVLQDVPDNSYIDFDILFSMSSIPRIRYLNNHWLWTTFETFVLLDEHATISALENKLSGIPRKYAESTLQDAMNQTFDDYVKSGKNWELFVQPFTSIHLHSTNIYNRLNYVGNATTVYILIGAEILIVLLSCINFMNLSTAQYTRRIKESGLRKIMGSDKAQLALHFFSEAFLFCCMAAIIGLGVVQIVLPYFSLLIGNNLKLDIMNHPAILGILFGLIILMSLLSGSYPSVFLSRFSPVEAMKGKFKTGKQGKSLRNGLVVFQFVISMALIVCTTVVYQQLKFLSKIDIGFNRENLMVVNHLEWMNDKETFVDVLGNIQGVEQVSWCSAVPPYIYDGDSFRIEGTGGKTTPLNYVAVDDQYATTLSFDFKVGRNFSKDIPADNQRVVLNETAANTLGWKIDESIIGKKIFYPRGNTDLEFEVAGVVRDFNYWSLNAPIQPMAIFNIEGNMPHSDQEFAVLRVKTGNTEDMSAIIGSVQKNWLQHAGNRPFVYDFVDDSFDRNFQSDEKLGNTLTVFAGLALLIASFGLLGMIIFTLEQRTKEIGIRKVVGASVANIWLLVVKDYTQLIGTAVILSIPLCIWGLNSWLEQFQYRVPISAWTFVIAGAGILLTAWLISSYHVIKAALMNPVDVLKDE